MYEVTIGLVGVLIGITLATAVFTMIDSIGDNNNDDE